MKTAHNDPPVILHATNTQEPWASAIHRAVGSCGQTSLLRRLAGQRHLGLTGVGAVRHQVHWPSPVAAARASNALPQHVRNAPSLSVFRRELKTVLFRSSFPDVIWQCTVLYLQASRSVLICHHLLVATNWFCWHCMGSCSSSAIMPPK